MSDIKFTPGPWAASRPEGWVSLCITAPSRDGKSERPLATLTKPKAYYTDFPTRIDENGEKWTVCSASAAEKAGNYVATPEIREAIDAQQEHDAHLIAAAPDMYEALQQAITSMQDSGYKNSHVVIRAGKSALAKARGES